LCVAGSYNLVGMSISRAMLWC